MTNLNANYKDERRIMFWTIVEFKWTIILRISNSMLKFQFERLSQFLQFSVAKAFILGKTFQFPLKLWQSGENYDKTRHLFRIIQYIIYNFEHKT